ncbi:serine hydrolase [Streptomyces spiramenti]|uniref:Serine hydrolase n=1 Tax=Streptomyces spiramenti TaxID=2720606 RepID=A0ABX1AS18_9ACTN|nr:serine hydrolase [Streptomyces spiramenti]NJP67092.1 serine hydrolase [Streptomyces spiramenti]
MSPEIPRQRTRRLAPALLGAAMATGVLAAASAGGAPEGVTATVPGSGAEFSDARPATDDGAPATDGDRPGAPDDARAPAYATRGSGERVPPRWADATAALARSVEPLEAEPAVRISVAVLDPVSGYTLRYGAGHYDTASIVKVDIVAGLLLLAQDEGRSLTAEERRLASDAVRLSDNDATHELWSMIGGEEGLDRLNARFGLTLTRGGEGGHWGLTRTTAADQVTVLRAVFDQRSPLARPARAYLEGLMGSVAEGQRWGVSAAAADADGTALKNGWLPRSTTGLWNINSIGRVEVGGREYLMAVLSSGHRTGDEGIERVEAAAQAAMDVIRSTGRA